MWREWALGGSGVTNAEYWNQVNACARILVELLGVDIGRWQALIRHFEHLPGPVQKEFLERLNTYDVAALDVASRRAITEALREKVGSHREYSDAEWALPGELLSELEKVQKRFEPADPVARNVWLFDPFWRVRDKLEGREENIGNLRDAALKEVVNQAGWEGILGLVKEAEAPEEVGSSLGGINSELETRILPNLLVSGDEKLSRFARGFVLGRYRSERWEWIRGLDRNTWSAEELGRVLLDLPFERRTWELAGEKGADVAEYYWKHTGAFLHEPNSEDVAFAVSMLVKHKQPPRAFDVISMAMHRKVGVDAGLIMEALEAGFDPEADSHRGGRAGVHYDLHLIFQELQTRVKAYDPKVDAERVARLEWSYLGLLDGYPASPVILHSLLRDNAQFFVDLLGLIFRSTNETEESRKEPTEDEKARGQNAYRLLMSWDAVPGSDDNGTVDEKSVLAWVRRARVLAEERGLLEICDSRIGEVFARDLERSGESWPSAAVRDAMEEIGTEELFDGFCIGVFNKRGMVSKSLTEGGAQERALAKKYQAFAEASKIEWPRTAAALRRVAQSYEEDARREDAKAMVER
jgi:hypothetical protein